MKQSGSSCAQFILPRVHCSAVLQQILGQITTEKTNNAGLQGLILRTCTCFSYQSTLRGLAKIIGFDLFLSEFSGLRNILASKAFVLSISTPPTLLLNCLLPHHTYFADAETVMQTFRGLIVRCLRNSLSGVGPKNDWFWR